ncbi:MAG TPA: hypothetical protein VJ761_06520 [Ktedonobacteraceae bacterium]|nr:hypothetical protein [Ktedonobacteraceae bacterium]
MLHRKYCTFVTILAACLVANLLPFFVGTPALALAQPLSCGGGNW